MTNELWDFKKYYYLIMYLSIQLYSTISAFLHRYLWNLFRNDLAWLGLPRNDWSFFWAAVNSHLFLIVLIVDNVRSAMHFIDYFLLCSQFISQMSSSPWNGCHIGLAAPFFSSVTPVILFDSENRIPSLFNNSKIVITFKLSAT